MQYYLVTVQSVYSEKPFDLLLRKPLTVHPSGWTVLSTLPLFI